MDIRAVAFDVNGTLIRIRTDDGDERIFRAAAHFLTYQGIDTHRHELRGIADYYRRELERLGVETRLETVATAEIVRAERPDAAVVATGSVPALPEMAFDGMPVVGADEVLSGRRFDGSVLVWDDDGRYRGPGAAPQGSEPSQRNERTPS